MKSKIQTYREEVLEEMKIATNTSEMKSILHLNGELKAIDKMIELFEEELEEFWNNKKKLTLPQRAITLNNEEVIFVTESEFEQILETL